MLAVQVLVWDVVLPGDYFALVWDLIMLLVILYLCIILPYSVAFAMDFVSGSAHGPSMNRPGRLVDFGSDSQALVAHVPTSRVLHTT
jgi:hypothetical protein